MLTLVPQKRLYTVVEFITETYHKNKVKRKIKLHSENVSNLEPDIMKLKQSWRIFNLPNTLTLDQIVHPSLQGFFLFSDCQDCYML